MWNVKDCVLLAGSAECVLNAGIMPIRAPSAENCVIARDGPWMDTIIVTDMARQAQVRAIGAKEVRF
jgi:hypothetical protein